MLERYQKLKTDDFELSRHVHALQSLDLEPLEAKHADQRVFTTANAFENEDIILYYFSYSLDVTLDAVAENPNYYLAIPVRMHETAGAGRRVSIVRGPSRLASPGKRDPLRLRGASQSLGICLKHHALQEYARPYFGDDVLAPIVFDHRFDMSRSANLAVARMIATIVEEEHVSPETVSDRKRMSRFLEDIVSTLVLYAPHNHLTLLNKRNPSPATRDVKRVVDYIHAYPDRAHTLGDLARVANVPGRTLNEHFRTFTGLSPMAYVKRQRLWNARRLLLSGAAESVAEAARQNGIFHMGRFASDYLAAFNERPSETLARRAF